MHPASRLPRAPRPCRRRAPRCRSSPLLPRAWYRHQRRPSLNSRLHRLHSPLSNPLRSPLQGPPQNPLSNPHQVRQTGRLSSRPKLRLPDPPRGLLPFRRPAHPQSPAQCHQHHSRVHRQSNRRRCPRRWPLIARATAQLLPRDRVSPRQSRRAMSLRFYHHFNRAKTKPRHFPAPSHRAFLPSNPRRHHPRVRL